MRRVYADDTRYFSKDPELIKHCTLLHENKEESETDGYKSFYKAVCSQLRESMKITKVVGVALTKERDSVEILVYDIEATDSNYYAQKFDEYGRPYIEVPEED